MCWRCVGSVLEVCRTDYGQTAQLVGLPWLAATYIVSYTARLIKVTVSVGTGGIRVRKRDGCTYVRM